MNKLKAKQLELYRPQNILALALLFMSFTVYLAFTSPYLDDWDSVQFALGLTDFDLAKHQPHPPGYPAYIFLGKVFLLFSANENAALTLLSAVSGALGVVCLYALCKARFGLLTGSLSAIIMGLSPAYLVGSIVAMNDVVALGFILLSVYCIFSTNRKKSYFGFFLVGFALGLRPQNIPVLFMIYIYAIFLIRDKVILSMGTLIAGVGVLSWLVPTAYVHDGFLNYFSLSNTQLQSIPQYRFEYGMDRIAKAFRLLASGWEVESCVLVLVILSVVLIEGVKRLGHKNVEKLHARHALADGLPLHFWITWFLVAIFTSLSWYRLYINRYVLLALPALTIIGATAITRILQLHPSRLFRCIGISVVAFGVITMGASAIERALILNRLPPAPVQAAQFISNGFDPDQSVIIHVGGLTKRHFDYYLKDYMKAVQLKENFLSHGVRWILSEKPLPFANEKPGGFRFMAFKRPAYAYPKHHHLGLYVYDTQKLKWIAEGTYQKEPWGFWLSKSGVIYVHSKSEKKVIFMAKMRAYHRPRRTRFSLNDFSKTVKIPSDRRKRVNIPLQLHTGWNRINIHSLDKCDSPKNLHKKPDPRCLSVDFRGIEFDPFR